MKAFLEKISERLLSKFPKSMEDIAVILPNKRAIVFLKSYLAKRIDNPIFLPQFFSIEEFIESLSGLKVIDNVSLQFYLYQSYLRSSSSKKDSFDDFLQWSSMLLHDFNEVDRNMVDAEAIFANLQDVKKLENWNMEDWSLSEESLTDSQHKFIDFYNGIYNWYTDFNKNLKKEKVAYQGMAYREAVNQLNRSKIPWNQIWFVGLNALTKSEQQLVDYLKKEDIARIFWDADEYYYNNPDHEAGEFLRQQRNKWREIDFEGVGRYFEQKKDSFNIIACPKNVAQSRVAAEVLKNLSEQDLSKSNTAIILADEGLLYPVLNHIPSNVKDINITMGSPLKDTIFYSLIDTLIEMQLRSQEYDHNVFYYKDVLRIINHPLFSKIADRNSVLKLRNDIISQNKVFISANLIKEFFTSNFCNVESIFSFWETALDSIRSIEDLISLFRQDLSGEQNSIEMEILFTFNKSLTMIKTLLLKNEFDVDLGSIQSILRQLVSKEIIPFQGEPLKGIQLMGILESRTLDFKNVILLSVNEGFLPKGKVLNSFIPYDLKTHFKMPTYRDSDAVYSYHFYRLLQRAKNITLVYNTETDDFGNGEQSRFISQLISEYKYNPIKEFIFGGDKLCFIEKKGISIQNKGLEDQIKKWSRWVSPSALNMYINCSLSFYYRYLANIRKLDEVEEFAESNIIGSAIHESLDEIYPIGNVNSSNIQDISNKLIDTVEIKFLAHMQGAGIDEGKNHLSLQIAKRLLSNFIAFEQRYLDESIKKGYHLNILQSEGLFEHDLHINGVNFTIKGKVDRIDEFAKELRIIDYKSGKLDKIDVSFKHWDDLKDSPSKSKALQLLIYAYLYLKNHPHYLDKKVIAGNFSFKNLREDLITTAKYVNNKKETLYINQDVMDKIELLIRDIVSDIMRKDFVQTEDKKRCEYCDYRSICNR